MDKVRIIRLYHNRKRRLEDASIQQVLRAAIEVSCKLPYFSYTRLIIERLVKEVEKTRK